MTFTERWRLVLDKYKIAAAAGAGLSAVAVWQHMGMRPQDMLILPLWAGIYCLFLYCRRVEERRVRTVSALVGFLFALFTALSRLGTGGAMAALLFVLRLFGFWALYGALLCWAYGLCGRLCLVDASAAAREDKGARLKVFFLSWAILYAWFLLWLLFRYPGGITIDSNLQLHQAMGNQPLTNHHPVIHTMIIKLIFSLGLFLFDGDQNKAVALYSGVQALMLSGCFAFLVESLYEAGFKKSVLISVLLVYILVPYHGSYSVTMWKDVWFGGAVLVLCTVLWRILRLSRRGGKPSLGLLVLLFISSVFMCLFRSNGYYAFILLLPFVFALFIKKCPAAALVPMAALILAAGVKGPLFSAMDIPPPDTIENLSIPAQHIARAIRDGAELSEEQEAFLSQAVDVEELARVYTPNCSDAVKELVRYKGNQQFIAENKAAFLRLWAELGLKYPMSYLRAQLDQTVGYWDPTVQYFVMAPDFVVSYELEIEAQSKLPAPLAAAGERLLALIPRIPIVSLVLSIGAGVWLFIALIGLCLIRRCYGELVLFIPELAVWLTLLAATPVHAEFRYIYSLFTTLPLLCVLPFANEDKAAAGV